MNNYLKTYKITLKTLSPVFIGSGKEINKKEYILSRKDQKIKIFDPGKLYLVLKKKGKAILYEDFLLKDARSNLNQWMIDNDISYADVQSAVKYSVSYGDRLELQKSRLSILEFAKDPYGLPYIPGSSLKGMLRTVLLSGEIIQNKNKFSGPSNDIRSFSCNKPSNRNYNKEAEKTETIAFNTLNRDEKNKRNAVNDVLQGLIVSDSRPLSLNDLVLCQKIDYSVEGYTNSLNILRECLKPGTQVEFDLTIDTNTCPYDVQSILEAVNRFAETYYSSFLSKFGIKKPMPDTVYLGGGVGFASKTFIYPMFDDGVKVTTKIMRNTMNSKDYNLHKHFNDVGLDVSPHMLKCTNYNGQRYQMGVCKITISELA